MSESTFKFGEFELDRNAYQLRRKGRGVTLERIPLDALILLVERRGNLVTRQEILERIWGKNVFVDVDSAINTAVRKIRRALNDDANSPRFIETIPAKGYRFLSPVRELSSTIRPSFRQRSTKSSLVGRKRQMETLSSELNCVASGSGRLVLISGEAGIGKTRLVEELAALAGEKEITALIGRCTDDEQAVHFLPFVEILESLVDQARSPVALRTMFGDLGGELVRLLPRLRILMPKLSPRSDLAPAETRRYLFNSFCDLVARVARKRLSLMILEDLHWADNSTLSLLDHLVHRMRVMPVLVIGTYRDSELDVASDLAKFLETIQRDLQPTMIKLNRLLPDEVAGLLRSLSGQEPPLAVTETMFHESKGNPFFIEELFRHLEEEGRLYNAAGKFRPRLGRNESRVPPSVRLMVSRRLRRLSPDTRDLLAVAALIGRSFVFELLVNSFGDTRDRVLACVEEAERSGLIALVEENHLRFEFSHELARQAVIAGLSAGRRQMLHLKIAESIREVYEHSLEDHFSDLASQYAQASKHEVATEFLHRAAEHAASQAMYPEAESYFAAALERIPAIPQTPERDALELRVRSSYGQVMAVTKGYHSLEVRDMAIQSHALAQKTGDIAELTRQLWMEVGFAETRGELTAAAKMIDELLSVAEREGSPTSLAMAYTYQVENRYFRGDFLGAEEYFERGRAFFEAPGFAKIQYGPTAAFGQASWNAWMSGYPDVARVRMEKATKATPLNPYDGSVLSQMRAVLHVFTGEFAAAESVAAKALTSSQERGFVELALWHSIPLGAARAHRGLAAEAIALLKHVVQQMTKSGRRVTITQALNHLAEAQAIAGDTSEALSTINEALLASTDELYVRPEIYRLRGELQIKRGNWSEAESDFREAIALARGSGAKSWELRSSTSLARILKNTGRMSEAREILRDIYNWFNQGFDTADLKEAKTLLQDINT